MTSSSEIKKIYLIFIFFHRFYLGSAFLAKDETDALESLITKHPNKVVFGIRSHQIDGDYTYPEVFFDLRLNGSDHSLKKPVSKKNKTKKAKQVESKKPTKSKKKTLSEVEIDESVKSVSDEMEIDDEDDDVSDTSSNCTSE